MRNWLITGVASGLGNALAHAALQAGDCVVGTTRSAAVAQAFTAQAPGRSWGLCIDLGQLDAIKQAVAHAEHLTHGIDCLVNNAGYGLIGGVEDASLEEVRAQFDINVFAPLALMREVLPPMRARRRGWIVNISSVSGLVGWPSLGLYSGSKFALEGISETLALEVAPVGIKVIIVEPGGMRTEFGGRNGRSTVERLNAYDATVGESRRILAEHAGKELGHPANAAAAILRVLQSESPPLRLVLGSDALGYVRKKLAAQSAEIAAWSDLALSTDEFPSCTHP